MSRSRIVILGSGTAGTTVANGLRRRFDPDDAEIHVVDRDDRHVYQPGLLFVPFGLAHVDEIVRPRRRQLRNGMFFHQHEVEGEGARHDRATRTADNHRLRAGDDREGRDRHLEGLARGI